MLDFPELLAPASSVKGRISRVCSFTMDLKPDTESDVIAGGEAGVFSAGPFGFGMFWNALLAVSIEAKVFLKARGTPVWSVRQ